MNVIRAAIVGDVETVKQWLTAPHTRHPRQVAQVLYKRPSTDMIKFVSLCWIVVKCLMMLYHWHYKQHVDSNQQSTAQLLLRHGHINTHNLTKALLAACVYGHMRIVTWLISDVMQLSQSDRIKWLLTTACARGDLSVVKQLATQVDSDVTRVMSQALRVACYNR
jgi:hypothetical protein